MDRRQRKTRNAVFTAFTELISKKDIDKITVAEIIEKADIGRATFYAHFETKDFLLKELCRELFCHVFDVKAGNTHKHIFECNDTDTVFLHILKHLQKNDNNILALLSSRNNGLFLEYFRAELEKLIKSELYLFEERKTCPLPDDLWGRHIASVFLDTVNWWIESGMKESPEQICQYFYKLV
jgi:AcrR family transcriptional regulator